MPSFVMNALGTATATIANGQSLSGAANLEGLRLAAIVMPSVWTSANLTFQVSHDNGVNWSNLYDQNGNEKTIVAAAARTIFVDPVEFSAFSFIKVRSGTSASPVAQGQESAITLALRTI